MVSRPNPKKVDCSAHWVVRDRSTGLYYVGRHEPGMGAAPYLRWSSHAQLYEALKFNSLEALRKDQGLIELGAVYDLEFVPIIAEYHIDGSRR